MSRILIIGYGNPLRGDDAVGFVAAERLRESITDPEVEILALHQLTPELMEPLSRAGRAIFLDAAAGGEPGTIRKRTIEPAAEGSGFTHQSTPGALLAGAMALFGHAPEAMLYSIPGGDFAFGEVLTPCVQRALEEVLAEITAACQGRE